MSKQKTFWAVIHGRKIQHLWQTYTIYGAMSSCGLVRDEPLESPRKVPKCKSCLRSIEH